MITEETRLKMRLAKLLAVKENRWKGMTGKKQPQEAREKMRKARLAYYKRVGGMPLKTKKLLREIALEKGSGLWMKGRKLDYNRDDKAWNWKGDKVGYTGLHTWIRRRKSKPEFCEHCKKVVPVDLANISGNYLRDINDFLWLCRKCHMIQDGRTKK